MNFRAFLEKIRSLSDNQKKIILWLIVAVLAAALGFLWFKITTERLKNLQKNEVVKTLNLPDFQGARIIPEIGDKKEELEKVENLIKTLEENPDKLEELEKLVQDNPDQAAELLINQDKLEEFLNSIE